MEKSIETRKNFVSGKEREKMSGENEWQGKWRKIREFVEMLNFLI
jgi:hypothetical protein